MISACLFLGYAALSATAAGVVSGGGHGSFAPLAFLGSWPLLALRLLSVWVDAYPLAFAIITFSAIVALVLYYMFLQSFVLGGVGRLFAGTAIHVVGGLICVYVWDVVQRNIPARNAILGTLLGLSLTALYLLLHYFLATLGGQKHRIKAHELDAGSDHERR